MIDLSNIATALKVKVLYYTFNAISLKNDRHPIVWFRWFKYVNVRVQTLHSSSKRVNLHHQNKLFWVHYDASIGAFA